MGTNKRIEPNESNCWSKSVCRYIYEPSITYRNGIPTRIVKRLEEQLFFMRSNNILNLLYCNSKELFKGNFVGIEYLQG